MTCNNLDKDNFCACPDGKGCRAVYDEGAKCPDLLCDGVLEFAPTENCSCHISPPCGSCVDRPLVCTRCKEEVEK